MLTYRTFFATYTGATPEEVIQAVYADARAGVGVSFEAWWYYQQDLWKTRYGIDIPPPDAPGAAQRMLDVLLDVGALEAEAA